MSARAYEAIIPLHEYDLRANVNAPNADIQQWAWLAPLALHCLKCGLALTAWATPPTLDVVVRTAREHELSAHPRPPAHRPGGGDRLA